MVHPNQTNVSFFDSKYNCSSATLIVGTLVYASYGKLDPGSIGELLESRDRRLTGPTMPPSGLYMHRVWYPGNAGVMMGTAGVID